jgi:hypothetical protein
MASLFLSLNNKPSKQFLLAVVDSIYDKQWLISTLLIVRQRCYFNICKLKHRKETKSIIGWAPYKPNVFENYGLDEHVSLVLSGTVGWHLQIDLIRYKHFFYSTSFY